jgi:diguanylate cyclase (GGDEF)-like protein/PAS domain S-box-containing protein
MNRQSSYQNFATPSVDIRLASIAVADSLILLFLVWRAMDHTAPVSVYALLLVVIVLAVVSWNMVILRYEKTRAGNQHLWYGTQGVVDDLREGKALLQYIIQSIDEVIYECDGSGVFRNVWASDESRLAMTTQEHIGRRITDVIGNEHGEILIVAFQQVIANRTALTTENSFVTNAGTRWFQSRVCPVIKDDKSCDSVVVLTREITELKNAEADLLESQNRYNTLLHQINDIVFAMDRNAVFTFLNQAWTTVTGFEVEESVGTSLLDHVPVAELVSLQTRLDLIAAGETEANTFILRYTSRSGEVRRLSLDIQPAKNADAEVNGFFGTATDVTEREIAEEAILIEREFLRGIIDTDPNLIFVKNEEGAFSLANNALAECFGTTVEDLIGKRDTDFTPTSEQAATYATADRQVLDSSDERFIAEEQILNASGEIRWLQTVKRPIFIPGSTERHVLGISTDITARKLFEQQLAHTAFHDPLTKLPNRALFMERLRHSLNRAQRQKKPVAAVFLDLDGFKLINDSLGHDAGDALLISVADRITSCVRPGDTVARLGGDEFTVLLEDLDDEGEVVGIVERIAEVLRGSVHIAGREISTSASLGVAFSHGEYTSPDAFLRDADTAMYEAKVSGKAHSVVFDLSMNTRATERLEIESGMQQALDRGEFTLHYQPIMHLESGKLSGVEALVRWNHPTMGLIPPIKFIPVAEQTGLIVPLGRWVLEEACSHMKHLNAEHPDSPDLTVSVNLSMIQLQQNDIVEQVKEVLKSTGLDARHLKLEITESVMMHDPDHTIPQLKALEELGIRLAVDDFGTGYSSLGYLSTLPLDTLKIDRTFVDKMENSSADTAIVQAIITLAKTLNLNITCEGVETQAQYSHLHALGCDHAQGYYFAHPLTSENLDIFVDPVRISAAA